MSFCFRWSCLTAVLIVASCRYAAGAEAPPGAASFFSAASTQLVRLSPKGGYVAMVVVLPGGKQVLGVRNTDDLNKTTTPVTSTGNNEIIAVHWINENRIGFTVKNLKIEFESNLDEFAVDRDGSALTHLISGNWEHQIGSAQPTLQDRVLTANYGFFDTAHDGSDDILVEKYFWNGVDPHPDVTRLYRLNTRSQRLTEVLAGSQPPNSTRWLLDGGDVPSVVSGEVKGRCFSSYRAPGSGEWAEIDGGDCYADREFTPLFLGAGDTLYVRAPYHGSTALYTYNLKQKKMASEPLLSAPGFDFDGGPEFDRVSNKVVGVHLHTDAQTSAWFDPRLKEIQRKIDAQLSDTNNTITCAQDCFGSAAMLVTARSDRQPPLFLLYTVATNKLLVLGGARPDIKPAQMGLRDFYHYTARDGRPTPIYVTVPPGGTDKSLPTVVLVHGGPHVRGSSWEWDGEAQFLASRGYLVLQPEFRGSTGFGADHFQAGWKQWGLAMEDDLADAAQWSIKQGWSDPRRIAIMGASYGGYATLMGLIEHPELFRCGVDWAGVTDIGMMYNTAEDDSSEDGKRYDMRTLIGDPDSDAAKFLANSPLANAARLTQPLLLAHGAQDRRVPLIHATRFRSAVEKNNRQVEWLVYSDEGHGWFHEDDRIDFWNHVEAFLDKHLKHAQ